MFGSNFPVDSLVADFATIFSGYREITRDLIEIHGVIPVIRESRSLVDRIVPTAEALLAGGLPIIELSSVTPDTLPALEALLAHRAAGGPHFAVGVGSIQDPEQARPFLELGVDFLVSAHAVAGPPEAEDLVVQCADQGIVTILGGMTPTELVALHRRGTDFQKCFPASGIGGPAYLRAVLGPHPELQIVATGGVSVEAADAYLSAGAVAVAVLDLTVSPAGDRWVLDEDFAAITARTRRTLPRLRPSPARASRA